jgi:hypothetical protein
MKNIIVIILILMISLTYYKVAPCEHVYSDIIMNSKQKHKDKSWDYIIEDIANQIYALEQYDSYWKQYFNSNIKVEITRDAFSGKKIKTLTFPTPECKIVYECKQQYEESYFDESYDSESTTIDYVKCLECTESGLQEYWEKASGKTVEERYEELIEQYK